MMVPRSYPFLQQSPPSPPQCRSEKMGSRRVRPGPTPTRTMRPKPAEKPPHTAPSSDPAPVLAAPMHSKPVVIPPRTPTRTGSATSAQTIRARGYHGGRPHHLPKNHKTDAIPPAVAALLAVTEIPKMPPHRRKGSTRNRRISMDELIQEWKQEDPELAPSVVGSPLDVLLGRVDESEDEYGSLLSVEQEKDSVASHSITSRSTSSESIPMPPSLDIDAPSFASNWDALSTPDSYGQRSLPDRREKVVSSPPKEDCLLDHPLLHFTPDDCEEIASIDIPDLVSKQPASSERFKSFKSNLTASLQALKSAAKSFSNFTAPSVPPDDLLTRSLLSPKFTSEMRPKQMQGLPPPALRRYLNPQPSSISPSELSMHLHDALMLDVDEDSTAPMIQMQTYERRGRRKRKSGNADPFSEAGRALSPSPAVRQREPRENSDFLRVIVLEMNMRRVGKLDAKAVGKARIWLPPRKLTSGKPPSTQTEGGVPDRWTAFLAEDV